MLYFDLGDASRFCFVITDANNSKLGFREEVFREFEKNTGARILELCTSDTHVTAAKTSSAKGYFALGDLISVEEFGSILKSLHDLAKGRRRNRIIRRVKRNEPCENYRERDTEGPFRPDGSHHVSCKTRCGDTRRSGSGHSLAHCDSLRKVMR